MRDAWLDGDAASPPRRNGELVFAAPWESRAFGLAVALQDAGVIDREAFRQRLIAEIADRGMSADAGDYYRLWLAALEAVLRDTGIVAGGELGERAAVLLAQPPEADHH